MKKRMIIKTLRHKNIEKQNMLFLFFVMQKYMHSLNINVIYFLFEFSLNAYHICINSYLIDLDHGYDNWMSYHVSNMVLNDSYKTMSYHVSDMVLND